MTRQDSVTRVASRLSIGVQCAHPYQVVCRGWGQNCQFTTAPHDDADLHPRIRYADSEPVRV